MSTYASTYANTSAPTPNNAAETSTAPARTRQTHHLMGEAPQAKSNGERSTSAQPFGRQPSGPPQS